ncbi:unnamed protein product [Ambrosiozyma monospora]|uniref:Unnamed protein product n=1 Tax=Ambrosiozyma monospora TaxID=43982 RepID=A0ACB5T3X6_AMBMO|nr:unnamed protein product [Ambrosiozyma monospora]
MNFVDANNNTRLKLPLIAYFHCTPKQLNLFDPKSMDSVHFLTLHFNELITDNDPCWDHFPRKTDSLNIIGTLPIDILDLDETSSSLGGMTLISTFKSEKLEN